MRARAVHDALCGGAIAFFAAYVAPFFLAVPLPWYLPLERRWTVAVHPAALGSVWYGQTAVALLVGLVGGAAVLLVGRARPVATPRTWALAVVIAFALAAALLVEDQLG